MTCLWSLPCNYRAGEEADTLVFNPKLFLPYTELEALGGEEYWNDVVEISVHSKESIIISCTGVLLVSWTCLALSSRRIFAQFFSLPETPSLLLLGWLLSSSFRSVLLSSLRRCPWAHYLRMAFPSLSSSVLVPSLVSCNTVTSCVLCGTLVYYSSPTRQECHSGMDVVYPAFVAVVSIVVSCSVRWQTKVRLIWKIPFLTERLQSNCPVHMLHALYTLNL